MAGKQEPKGDGALIFDEVKVACQLMWNSCNNQLMGLAMTSTDLASLNDIYKILIAASKPLMYYSFYGET